MSAGGGNFDFNIQITFLGEPWEGESDVSAVNRPVRLPYRPLRVRGIHLIICHKWSTDRLHRVEERTRSRRIVVLDTARGDRLPMSHGCGKHAFLQAAR